MQASSPPNLFTRMRCTGRSLESLYRCPSYRLFLGGLHPPGSTIPAWRISPYASLTHRSLWQFWLCHFSALTHCAGYQVWNKAKTKVWSLQPPPESAQQGKKTILRDSVICQDWDLAQCMEVIMDFQNQLKQLRKQKNISIYRLSKMSGVPWSTIRLYESGSMPTLDKADRLLKALGATLVLGVTDRKVGDDE